MLPSLNLLSQTAIQSKLTFTNRKADLNIIFFVADASLCQMQRKDQ